MQTINLDTEIVATSYDPATRMNYYTIERGGRRWTASVHTDHLAVHKANKEARRRHVGNVLVEAMRGPSDTLP